MKEETSPRLTSGTACGGSYAVFYSIYVSYLLFIYLNKNLTIQIVVRLAIYGSVNRFSLACTITGRRDLFED